MGKQWTQWQTLFPWAPKSLQMVTAAMKLKDACSLEEKSMTNLDRTLKRRDIILPTKICLVKAMVFPVVMYGCESWTIKKAECWWIDAFELRCWRRLSIVPWMGFLHSSVCKESACNAGDLGLIPELGRYPEGGLGNLLQYSCLENPLGQKCLADYSPWGCKELDTTERLSTQVCYSFPFKQQVSFNFLVLGKLSSLF